MTTIETVLAYEAGVRDGLAQARKRDTMLDDMCNLIDERDILLAEKALLESERDALKAQVDEWVKENGPGGWIDGLRTQNALLAEALKGLVAEMDDVLDSIENEKVHFDGDGFHERLTLAVKALAAVKEMK